MSTLKVNGISARFGSGTVAIPAGNKLIGADPASVYAPGVPVQVGRYDWTNVTEVSASAGWVDATNASFTFTPKLATSKLLVVAELAMAPYYPGGSYAGMAARILRDGAVISIQGQTHEIYVATGSDMYSRTVKSVYINTNATTPTVFKIQIAGYGATTNARLNQGSQWNSCFTIWEVA